MIAQLIQMASNEVDIRYVGRVNKFASGLRGRLRPLEIGCLVGHFQTKGGTLGCFVRDRRNGKPGILSNNHVLAAENRANVGDAILQPGFSMGTSSGTFDKVAELNRFAPLLERGINFVDAAFANLTETSFEPTIIQDIGAFSGQAGATEKKDRVKMLGQASGATDGIVTSFDLDNIVINYSIGDLRFDNQIEVEGASKKHAFAGPGDSGALVLNKDQDAIGLVFGGSDTGGSNGKGLTYVNPMPAVMSACDVDFL